MADDSMRLSARDPRASEAIAKTVQALEDLSLQREKARVTEINKTVEAQRALLAPFQKLIAESPAATRALEKLRRHRVEEMTPLVRNLSAAALDRPSATLFSLHLQADLSFTIPPPYDSDWQWGNPDLAVHNPVTGQAIVRGASGHVQTA